MRTMIPGEIKSALLKKPSFVYYGGIFTLILSFVALFFINRLIGALTGLLASLFLLEYRRKLEEQIQQEVSEILHTFKNKDFDGRYNPNTPVSEKEKWFKGPLRRKGFEILYESKDYNRVIIPQYELTSLNWGEWENGSTKNYTADFAYLDYSQGIKIDIELDAESKASEPDEMERLQRRDKELLGRGWFVIRIWNNEADAESVDGIKRLIKAIEGKEIKYLISMRKGERPWKRDWKGLERVLWRILGD